MWAPSSLEIDLAMHLSCSTGLRNGFCVKTDSVLETGVELVGRHAFSTPSSRRSDQLGDRYEKENDCHVSTDLHLLVTSRSTTAREEDQPQISDANQSLGHSLCSILVRSVVLASDHDDRPRHWQTSHCPQQT